jgi:intraflagellar transport protein 140
LQGTVKQVLQFTEVEGDPFLATINGTFLAVGTTQGVVKIFDLSRREAKSIGGSMNMKTQLPNFGTLRDLGISCDGSKVTMTVIKVAFFQLHFTTSSLLIW